MFSNHRVERQLRGAMARQLWRDMARHGETWRKPLRVTFSLSSSRSSAYAPSRCCFLRRSAVSTTSGLGLTVARVVDDALSVTVIATCDLLSAVPVRSRVLSTTPSFFFPARESNHQRAPRCRARQALQSRCPPEHRDDAP